MLPPRYLVRYVHYKRTTLFYGVHGVRVYHSRRLRHVVRARFFRVLYVTLSNLLLRRLQGVLFESLRLLHHRHHVSLQVLRVLYRPIRGVLLGHVVITVLRRLRVVTSLRATILRPTRRLTNDRFEIVATRVDSVQATCPFHHIRRGTTYHMGVLLRIFQIRVVRQRRLARGQGHFFHTSKGRVFPGPHYVNYVSHNATLHATIPRVTSLLYQVHVNHRVTNLPMGV